MGLLERFLAKKRVRTANKLIPENLRKGRILDIGCGKTPFFLFNTKFKEKHALDKNLCSASIKEEGIIFKKFDLEKEGRLPYNDGFFDVVTMLAVIEHLEPEKLVGILREIRRIIKLDGNFILTTPCFWTKNLIKIMMKLKLISSIEAGEHKIAYSRKLIINQLEEAGFERTNISFGYFEGRLNSWVHVKR